MGKTHAEREIRTKKRHTRSVGEQVQIDHAMWDNAIVPNHDGIRAAEIEDRLGLDLTFNPRTSLGHLAEIDMVEEFFPPGPEVLAIAEWMGDDGEVVLGEVDEAAEEGIEALIDDIRDSDSPEGGDAPAVADGGAATLRHVVADTFDLEPEAVEEHLKSTDDQVKALNKAVDSIEETEGFDLGDDYGRIAFINRAYRYRLTDKAIDLYQR